MGICNDDSRGSKVFISLLYDRNIIGVICSKYLIDQRDDQMGHFFQHGSKNIIKNSIAVSYTHLDVYKRQALEYVKKENGKYRIYFPQSCVLYLRGKNGPDFLEMELVMPDGQLVNYKVPVIRAERYTSDMIFQKKLLFLLPFYIIRYEKSVKKIEEDDAAFQTLIAEYGEIGKKLEKEFLAEGKEREYRDLIGLIDRILDYVCKESSRARKGIGDITVSYTHLSFITSLAIASSRS